MWKILFGSLVVYLSVKYLMAAARLLLFVQPKLKIQCECKIPLWKKIFCCFNILRNWTHYGNAYEFNKKRVMPDGLYFKMSQTKSLCLRKQATDFLYKNYCKQHVNIARNLVQSHISAQHCTDRLSCTEPYDCAKMMLYYVLIFFCGQPTEMHNEYQDIRKYPYHQKITHQEMQIYL